MERNARWTNVFARETERIGLARVQVCWLANLTAGSHIVQEVQLLVSRPTRLLSVGRINLENLFVCWIFLLVDTSYWETPSGHKSEGVLVGKYFFVLDTNSLLLVGK